MMSKHAIIVSLIAAFGLWACDDKPKRRPPPKKPPAARRPPKPPPPPPPKPEPKVVLELTAQDFVESAANRDPFRSYLHVFRPQGPKTVRDQRPAKLERYALDELRLIAVITGDVRARAMFRDPKGTGVTVKRGDLISKNRGRVKVISDGRVIVEITSQYDGGQKVAERVIELWKKKVN